MLKHHIKATNFELTPAISDYLSKKLSALDKFTNDVEAIARIEVGRTTHHHNKGDIFRAEINLDLGDKSKMFRAVCETSDIYSAIDQMKDDILAEVTKAKRKNLHLLKRGHQKIKDIMRRISGK